MHSNKVHILQKIIQETTADEGIKGLFTSRLGEGNITRDENPKSHFCTYFPAYDPLAQEVFIGLHKKSGLWLFNGGHIDRDESPEEAVTREITEEWGTGQKVQIPSPSLLTITEIENPKKQTCEHHFDIWYFFAVDKRSFNPDPLLLSKEFHEWGWKSTYDTKQLIRNKETLLAVDVIETLFQ